MSDRYEIPSNCLVLPQRDGYYVEFEAEAVEWDDGYKVWLSLCDEENKRTLVATVVKVPSLDQFTIKGVAIGFARAWDCHI